MKNKLSDWREPIGIISLIIFVMSCQNFIPDGAGFKEYALYILSGIALFILFYGGLPSKKKESVKFPEIKLIAGLVLQVVFLFVGRIEAIMPFAMILCLAAYALSRAGSIGLRKNSERKEKVE